MNKINVKNLAKFLWRTKSVPILQIWVRLLMLHVKTEGGLWVLTQRWGTILGLFSKCAKTSSWKHVHSLSMPWWDSLSFHAMGALWCDRLVTYLTFKHQNSSLLNIKITYICLLLLLLLKLRKKMLKRDIIPA